MRALRAVGAAFGMFSRIPVPSCVWGEDSMKHALAAFPLVGVVQGAVALLVGLAAGAIGAPSLLAGAALTAVPLAVNGGIHMDGLCDTADALASRAPRERMLEILKDPHAGAFGIMWVCTYLVFFFALMASLPLDWRALVSLIGVFGLSRALSGAAMRRWRKARADGLAFALSERGADARAAESPSAPAAGRPRAQAGEPPHSREGEPSDADARRRADGALVALAVQAVLCAVLLAALQGVVGLVMVVAALAALALYRWVAYRRFGGVTGDIAGWFLQWAELAMVVVLVAGCSL